MIKSTKPNHRPAHGNHILLAFLILLMAGCAREPAPPPPATETPAAVVADLPAETNSPAVATSPPTAEPSPSPTPVPPTQTPTATLTAVPPTPTFTPDPYAPLTIAALRTRTYGGGTLDIVDTLARNETFTRYEITYPSDGLTIHGYLNVPNEGNNFPVVLLLHGYIAPEEYELVPYTERYAIDLVDAGFMVIHPNFRNYPPSDSGPNPYRIGYAVDVLNLIAIIREQSLDPAGYLRRADADRIYLWGHSMGGGVALRTAVVNREPYLRGVLLYGAMSGDEAQNYEKILEWSGGETGSFELAATPAQLAAISPNAYLAELQTPLSIHHSVDDAVVPYDWSAALCAELVLLAQPHTCFTYYQVPHTFRGSADTLLMQRTIAFFQRH